MKEVTFDEDWCAGFAMILLVAIILLVVWCLVNFSDIIAKIFAIIFLVIIIPYGLGRFIRELGEKK